MTHEIARTRRLRAIDRALVLELAEHTAVAARLAAALAASPDNGDGGAFLPEDIADDDDGGP